jgi:hypothetical protein
VQSAPALIHRLYALAGETRLAKKSLAPGACREKTEALLKSAAPLAGLPVYGYTFG